MRVVYSAAARADLVEIWVYVLDNADVVRADAVIDRILARIAGLGEQPMMGPSRDDIASGARCLVVERWLALYRVEAESVQIIRVVDGVRDLRRLSL